VVVGAGVRLLQLDDRRVRAELLQPGVRVSVVAAGSWHALVPDVQAGDDRDVLLVAWRQQRAQPADRGGLPRRGQVLGHQAGQVGGAGVGGEQAEGSLQVAPQLAATVLPAALSEDRTAAFHDDGSAALGDRLRGSPSAQRLLPANRH
jgi:hypothetical protein